MIKGLLVAALAAKVVWLDVDPAVLRGGHEPDDGLALVQSFHSPEIASIWDALPGPDLELDVQVESLNYFTVPDAWMERRKKDLASEITRIRNTISSRELPSQKVKCSRYLPSLLCAPNVSKGGLLEWLEKYQAIVSA